MRVESALGVHHAPEFADVLRDLLPHVPPARSKDLADEVLKEHDRAGKTTPARWVRACAALGLNVVLHGREGCSRCMFGDRMYLVWRSPVMNGPSLAGFFWARPEDHGAVPFAVAAECDCPTGRALTERNRRRERLEETETALIRRSRGALAAGDFFNGSVEDARRMTTPRSVELVAEWLREPAPRLEFALSAGRSAPPREPGEEGPEEPGADYDPNSDTPF